MRQNPKCRTESYQFAQQDVISLHDNRPYLRRRARTDRPSDERYSLLDPYIGRLSPSCAKRLLGQENWAIIGRLYRREDIDSPKALEGQQETIPNFAPSARIFLNLEEALILVPSASRNPGPSHLRVINTMSQYGEDKRTLNREFYTKTFTSHQFNPR
ncbi:hypothetical protein BGZ94_003665 [Podila epigama]|nr:hypothetical protein BGZ94_003665 [Podila epigama]